MTLRERVAALVRARRDELGMTVRAVAARGMSHSTYHQIEMGTLNASLDSLEDVARVLDARWEARLVPATATPRDAARQEAVDRLEGMIDRLDVRDVRHLIHQLDGYERELAIQGRKST